MNWVRLELTSYCIVSSYALQIVIHQKSVQNILDSLNIFVIVLYQMDSNVHGIPNACATANLYIW